MGGKLFDFTRITLFCLEKTPLKAQNDQIWGGHGPFAPPGYAYERKYCARFPNKSDVWCENGREKIETKRKSTIWWKECPMSTLSWFPIHFNERLIKSETSHWLQSDTHHELTMKNTSRELIMTNTSRAHHEKVIAELIFRCHQEKWNVVPCYAFEQFALTLFVRLQCRDKMNLIKNSNRQFLTLSAC